MPLADWTVPFELTSAVYAGATTLSFNTPVVFSSGTGTYFLRGDGCALNNQVRQTKDFVPQEDGAILHRRFTGGMEMNLAIQLWENDTQIACDTLLQEMLDELMGYLYGLLNACDNEGRVSWLPDGGSSTSSTARMLEDIRLLSYPVESQQPGSPFEVNVTVDTAWPYAADLTQLGPSVPGAVVNNGNRPTFPVWKIYGPFNSFTLTNTSVGTATTHPQFKYDGSLPGAMAIAGGDYIEINTFKNTAYRNGNLTNLKPGIVMLSSEFFTIPPGSNTITLTYGGAGGASVGLINAAWA